MDTTHILIVDDSPIIRKSLAKRLEDFEGRIIQAEDGQQALEIALAQEIDLIITDVEMPRLDGFSLCKKLKETAATRGIPVIILSTLDSDADIDRGFQHGAAAYISKANAALQLQDTIERVLQKAAFKRDQTIMVVDDSSTIRRLVDKGLGEAGFPVITAENGRQALELIRAQRPDLILSDIDMPIMNGIDFCEIVHQDVELAAIPFVIMSANADRGLMRRMLHRGAIAYMVKPFNLEQLVMTVEKLLSDQFLLLLKDRERLNIERTMMLASITSLIEALEARDQYTRGHSESVADIVTRMAAHRQEDDAKQEILSIGGKLHDLGKIGVPDSILLKAGQLTAAEFAILQRHPSIGADILGSIPTLKEIIPVILHHHERFDGKGYPAGLKGEKIPLWARMTAVADTFHAITSDRPYRKGLSRDEAFQIIADNKGTQLCPECVDLFFDMNLCLDMQET